MFFQKNNYGLYLLKQILINKKNKSRFLYNRNKN